MRAKALKRTRNLETTCKVKLIIHSQSFYANTLNDANSLHLSHGKGVGVCYLATLSSNRPCGCLPPWNHCDSGTLMQLGKRVDRGSEQCSHHDIDGSG